MTDKDKDDASELMRGLAALDKATIAAGNPGPPGSGLYLVLETAASQFLGVPRSGFPAPEPAEAKHEPPKQEPPEPPKAEPAKAQTYKR